jgi:phage gpG-like protein
MLRIEFEVNGFPDMLRAVQAVEKSATVDVEEILDEAAAIMLNRIRTRFLHKEDPDNNPWIPSAAGLAREARGGPGTLFDTGRLFRSIQLFAPQRGERTIGTDVDYARKIQEGGWHAFDNPLLPVQPARVFLAAGGDDISMMQKLLEKRLSEAVAKGA